MDEMDEIVQEFLVESYENLDQLDRDLVSLEQTPGSSEHLSSIFRTIHTIKGTSGFLAFSALEQVAHVGENLLSRLRDGELELTVARTDVLLQMVDCIRSLLGVIERTGGEGDIDIAPVVTVITAAMTGETTSDVEPTMPEATGSEHTGAGAERSAGAPASTTDIPDTSAAATSPPAEPVEPALFVTGPADTAPAGDGPDPDAAPVKRKVADSSIRVDVDLLDALMMLVGELVLIRNQIVQYAAEQDESDLVRASQRLDLIVSELQEGVMRTRMQPIDHIWSKLPRVVRDLGVQCGKSVQLEMEGRETELDKTLLEAVKDPLTHLVRNAVDHGIETADRRRQAGKTSNGTLSLRAFHEGGQVVVEVADDGAGIDPGKVAAKAVDRGLVSAEQVSRMKPREVLDLIFAPGFSTAAAVTNVSGRGVGMDVVRTNVEKIGGAVDLSSVPGLGTTVRVKIPLTLAIIPALIIAQDDQRYAIPQTSLLELVRLEGRNARQAIEYVAGVPVFRLRGKLLPLVSLGTILGRPSGLDADVINVVVLSADETQFGLIVDEIRDTQEIVVKPLGRQIKSIPVFAGATIMGDGKVALILDVLGVAAEAGALSAAKSTEFAAADEQLTGESASGSSTLLVVRAGRARLAMPLAEVSRLEEIPARDVELAGGREVVQYRGNLLPLLRLSEVLQTGSGHPGSATSAGTGQEELLPVVVHSEGESAVGLVVDEIVDIAEEQVTTSSVGARAGILGSAVVQSRVTDLLHLDALLPLVRQPLDSQSLDSQSLDGHPLDRRTPVGHTPVPRSPAASEEVARAGAR